MTINPLVVGSLEGPKDIWSGVWIAEDIELIAQGIKNGSWIDGTLGVVGAGLDALAIVSDPVGALLQYGIAWLIEHVKPLSDALDWLAGNPGQIAGHAQTWRNIAKSLEFTTEDLGTEVTRSTGDWQGMAGDAYRRWAQQQHDAIAGIAKAADTMATITEGAGILIAAVRIMVRDAIATAVSRLIVYAAELIASWGTATPLVVEQVTTLVASWGARIARWLKALLASLRRLMPIIRRLGELIEELKKILTRLRNRASENSLLLRVRKKGAGRPYPMNMESVRAVAAKYGIDISNLRFTINKNIAGWCGQTKPDGSIELYRTAFRSEEDLARTLEHEKLHHDDLASGKPFPKTREEFDLWEDRAYAHEDQWWDNQLVRPEG